MLDVENKNESFYFSIFEKPFLNKEILKRIILSAKVYKWEKERLYNFLLPGNLQKNKGLYIDLKKAFLNDSGIGYWLINHNNMIKDENIIKYKNQIDNIYANIDIEKELLKLNLTNIVSNNSIDLKLSHEFIYLDNIGFIYFIKN